MTRFPVEAPHPVAAADLAGLGRLGPVLRRLAGMQGAWPPRVPRSVRTLVVGPGAGGGSAFEVGPGVGGGSAFEAGVAEADSAADVGVDLLVLGAAGDPVPGLVAAAALLSLEPVEAVGTRAGPDWTALTVGVREGLAACRSTGGDPARVLELTGSPLLARLTGLLVQSSVRRTPVVLDGSPLVLGAALVASRMAPGAQQWWLAGQAPPAPAAARALSSLALEPLLDLGLDRPEGAALAHLLLVGAIGLLDDGA